MPQPGWSDKRERQYEHIKEGLLERGTGEDRAEEIAARTVNKERARNGEAAQGGRTYDQLRNEAKERGIKGRSRMNKAELERVLSQ
jgi:plasmid stabilization system protein ParE